MNKYKKNAEQSFVFCGTSSSFSGAKGKTLREHFFLHKYILIDTAHLFNYYFY